MRHTLLVFLSKSQTHFLSFSIFLCHIHTHTHTHTHTLSLSNFFLNTFSFILYLCHTHIDTLSLSLSLFLTHIISFSLTHILSLSLSHAHTFSLSHIRAKIVWIFVTGDESEFTSIDKIMPSSEDGTSKDQNSGLRVSSRYRYPDDKICHWYGAYLICATQLKWVWLIKQLRF